MENLSHTLAGMALAEAVCQVRSRGEKPVNAPVRLGIYLTSGLANNLPDLDLLYLSITEGPLGYLLHHRGHTHTLAAVIPMAMVCLIAPGLLSLRPSVEFTRRDWTWMAMVAVLGGLLHLTFDFLNNYGIHPFWPLRNDWYYGDSVFIIEPAIWATTLPGLIFATRWWQLKAPLTLLLALALLLCWFSGFVPPPLASGVTLWCILLLLGQWKLSPGPRSALTLAGLATVIGVFMALQKVARSQVENHLTLSSQSDLIHDLVLTPMPANPLCWSLITVEISKDHDRYRLRQGFWEPWSSSNNASMCPTPMKPEKHTAPITPLNEEFTLGSGKGVWTGAFEASLSELRTLSGNCQIHAFLRFARAPFWIHGMNGVTVGDLRYDRREETDFPELTVNPANVDCPRFVPPWTPPTAPLLAP